MKSHIVTSVEGFVRLIASLTEDYEGTPYAFRGHSDCSWSVTSGVRRRGVKDDRLCEYLAWIIANARKRRHITAENSIRSDLSVMSDLQHFGAATLFIDFTYNSLLALFFSCIENIEMDGCVYCYELLNARHLQKNEEKYTIDEIYSIAFTGEFIYDPDFSSERVIKQSSLFLFNTNGIIEDSCFAHKIIIRSRVKKSILKRLRSMHGIDYDNIFPDFVGYAQANRANKELPDTFWEEFDYLTAVEREDEIHHLKRMIVKKPYEYENWIKLGELQLKVNDTSSAMKSFSNALQLEPGNCVILLDITDVCIRYNNNALALEYNDRALLTAPNSSGTLKQISENYGKCGKHDKSIEILKKVILTENTHEVNFLISDAYYSQWMNSKQNSDMLQAIKFLSISLELDTNNVSYLLQLGNYYYDFMKYKKALKYYLEASSVDSEVDCNYFIGIAYNALAMYTKADKYLTNCYKKNSEDVEAIDALGYNKYCMKNFKKSEYYLLKAHRMEPDNASILVHLGIMYDESKQYGKAIEEYKRYIEKHHDDTDTMNLLSAAYEHNGDLDLSFKTAVDALEADPENADIWARMGWLYLIKSDFIRANYYLEKSLSIKSNYVANMTMGHMCVVQQNDVYKRYYITAYIEDNDPTRFYCDLKQDLELLLKDKLTLREYKKIRDAIDSDVYRDRKIEKNSTLQRKDVIAIKRR